MVYFNQPSQVIQIHLMLLLIQEKKVNALKQKNSNTSHVTINQERAAVEQVTWLNSNTSHVTINHPWRAIRNRGIRIQIHLMLLLIDCKR